MEKKDGEALGLLRQSHEINLLEAMKVVRENQISEAQDSLNALIKSKELAEKKKLYYESRDFMNFWELMSVGLNGVSLLTEAGAAIAHALSGGVHLAPQATFGASGFGGSPVATATFGGENLGDSAESAANLLMTISRLSEKSAGMAAVQGNYQRRQDEWDFQKDLAVKEMEQIDYLIEAAGLRVAIAEKERDNHNMQTDNARAIDDVCEISTLMKSSSSGK